MLKLSNVFERNAEAYISKKYRYLVNQGGTSSTKTFSILQLLTFIALKYPKQIDIVGLSVPHLKTGILNDMPAVCAQLGINFDSLYNKSDKYIKFPSGGKINFIAFDNLGKAHGGRRDILYLNEANHLHYKICEQLMVRTRDCIFIDYNPTNIFWVQKKIQVEEPEKLNLIKSTYKDNPFLEQSIIDMIESKKGDGNNNFWRVYGMGELGVAEGLIFSNFEMLDFDKNSFAKYRNGVDWGFSDDPFAYIRLAIEKNNLYICDEIYQTGLLNKDSAPLVLKKAGSEIVFCDSAEPKSIADFRTYKVKAIKAPKGPGSIESGIKYLQSFDKIYIHTSCTNIYDEFCNYQWVQDKNGDNMPVPIDAFNHAIDAIRYALSYDIAQNKVIIEKGINI